MAAMHESHCDHCHHRVEVWDDGNPYYFDEVGTKKYAYHPDAMRDHCVGNDSPQLCLSCSSDFMQDSGAPIEACPKCGSQDFVDMMQIDWRPCPLCREGVFNTSVAWAAIS